MRTFEAKTSIEMFDLLIDLAERETLVSATEAGRFRRISSILKQDHSTASHMGEEAVLELGMLLVDRWGGPEVGAVLALKTDLTRLGLLGQLILQSETPHAVFYQMARFNRLLNQRSAFELSVTPYRPDDDAYACQGRREIHPCRTIRHVLGTGQCGAHSRTCFRGGRVAGFGAI